MNKLALLSGGPPQDSPGSLVKDGLDQSACSQRGRAPCTSGGVRVQRETSLAERVRGSASILAHPDVETQLNLLRVA